MTMTFWGETDYTIDWSVADKSLDNLSAANVSAVNYSNYSKIVNFTGVSFTNSTQSAKAVAVPINEVMIPVWGYWLYVLIIFYLSMLVYGKTESLGATSITIMLLSSLAIGPSIVGVNTIPEGVSTILYVLAGLGLAGCLLSWLIEK
jgi:hypothetical protein